MRNEYKFFRIVMALLLMASFAHAANLTITSYTDPATMDFQGDDTLQTGLAEKGIIAEHFQTSPPGVDPGPVLFGTTTADAAGFGDFGATFATHDFYPTGIVYSLNTDSRWYNGNILKDITIYVLPTDTIRRYYDFQVQYLLNDGTGIYYDAVTNEAVVVDGGESSCTQITDRLVPEGTGTKIEISEINAANVSRVWIWTTPSELGFQKFSTTIAEIDVNFENCSSFSEFDLNADCTVDISDMAVLSDEWLQIQ